MAPGLLPPSHLFRWKIEKTWKERCHDELPSPENAQLRVRLLQLEDIHGTRCASVFPQPIGKKLEILQELAIW